MTACPHVVSSHHDPAWQADHHSGVVGHTIEADAAALLLYGVLDHLISETLSMDLAAAAARASPILDALTNGFAPRNEASTGP